MKEEKCLSPAGATEAGRERSRKAGAGEAAADLALATSRSSRLERGKLGLSYLDRNERRFVRASQRCRGSSVSDSYLESRERTRSAAALS